MNAVAFCYVRLNIFYHNYWYARSISIRSYISALLEIALPTPVHLLTPVLLRSPFRDVL